MYKDNIIIKRQYNVSRQVCATRARLTVCILELSS